MRLIERLRVSRATAVVIAFVLIAAGLGGTLLLDQEPLFIAAAAGLCLLLLATLPTAAEVQGGAEAEVQGSGLSPVPGPVTVAEPVAPVSTRPPVPVVSASPPPSPARARLQADTATALPIPETPSTTALARERVVSGITTPAGVGLATAAAAGLALWARRHLRR